MAKTIISKLMDTKSTVAKKMVKDLTGAEDVVTDVDIVKKLNPLVKDEPEKKEDQKKETFMEKRKREQAEKEAAKNAKPDSDKNPVDKKNKDKKDEKPEEKKKKGWFDNFKSKKEKQ